MKEERLKLAAFQTIIENTKDMIFIKDVHSVYLAASMSFVKMVGKEREEDLLGKTDLEIFEDSNLAKRYLADDRKLLAKGQDLIDYIEPITDEDGRARYGSTSKYILRGEEQEPIGILGITKDITREYMVRQHYQQELKCLFELPADTYAVSYLDIDSWRIITQRKNFIHEGTLQTCYSIEELCDAAVKSIVDTDCEAYDFYRDFTPERLYRAYESGRTQISFEYQRRLTNDMVRWVHNDLRFLTDVDSGHLCVMLLAKDIDTEKEEEQKLVVAARMDKMTMLLNRETTMEEIRKILKEDSEKTHVLYMLDIDNFKSLNDTMGHMAGDDFLVKLAKAMKKCFRESDIVGRIGGDEFFIFMRNLPTQQVMERKAQELLQATQKVCGEYPQVSLSGSIGVSVFPEHGTTLEELYGQADVALYEAKRKGKNQYIFAV